jgi:triacylglycerol esterase/lipase EstA (alpha/beta hydrolase family)
MLALARLLLWVACGALLVSAAPASTTTTPRVALNDFDCRSSAHPNPVVLLHGLGATYYEDLNVLGAYLQSHDFCIFSITYGDYAAFPFVGGLKPIAQSAVDIANFIKEVQAKTGAAKIDLVGHSEGAFQSLYVPKFLGLAAAIDKIVAIAPPTHGTNFGGLYKLAQIGGGLTEALVMGVLDVVGCEACSDLLPDGAAVVALDDGPIVQPGNTVTIIASLSDELVTPTTTSFVDEPNVRNLYVQDYCPLDPVGHIGEAYDLNVWNLVLNSLESVYDREFSCVVGSPGR